MQKSTFVIFILAVVASLPDLSTPVKAAMNIPGAPQYGGGSSGGGRNCGFSTLEQCRVTISGIGGFCAPNVFYPGSVSDTSQSKRKRQY